MQQLCLAILRLLPTAWVGAATLFVAVGVSEIRSPEFDSAAKDALVLIRFPLYYGFGFTALAIALVSAIVCVRSGLISNPRAFVCAILLAISLAVMAVDYLAIYRPLVAMIQSPDSRPENFSQYHEWSKWINAGGLVLWLGTAVIACWPSRNTSTNKVAATTLH